MPYRNVYMLPSKRVVLIAHSNREADLLEWARRNRNTLNQHRLYATGTTTTLLANQLGLFAMRCMDGSDPGNQVVDLDIVEGHIDFVVFFWDRQELCSHFADVQALLRIAVAHNIPIASNRETADFLLSSSFVQHNINKWMVSPARRVQFVSESE